MKYLRFRGGKRMKYDRPIFEIIEESAKQLTSQSKEPFSRRDIIEHIESRYPDINENTINPMIQGMTKNLKGGSPGAVGKNILLSVGRGRFVLAKSDNTDT